MLKTILFCCLAEAFLAGASACNGCAVKKTLVEACPGTEETNVVRASVEDFRLDENCVLKVKGWLNATRSIEEPRAEWQFKKGSLERKGYGDGCKELKNTDNMVVGVFVEILDNPKCPLEEGDKRIDKEVDLSRFRDVISITKGSYSGRLEISHGNDSSCHIFESDIQCKPM